MLRNELQHLLRGIVNDALEHADRDLFERLYRTVSVHPVRVHRQLTLAGRRYCERGSPHPSPTELHHSAQWILAQHRFKTTALGGAAGLGGGATIPPEILAQGVGFLRLAQRLCIVYGFDPQTDRGAAALYQVLAAGLQITLPSHGPVGLRMSDLVKAQGPQTIGYQLARGLLQKTTHRVGGRLSRYLPVLSGLLGAHRARTDSVAAGERMIQVLERITEPGTLGGYEDAVVVT